MATEKKDDDMKVRMGITRYGQIERLVECLKFATKCEYAHTASIATLFGDEVPEGDEKRIENAKEAVKYIKRAICATRGAHVESPTSFCLFCDKP